MRRARSIRVPRPAWFGTIALCVAGLACGEPPAAPEPAAEKGIAIELANRRLEPEQGIDPTLSSQLAAASAPVECLVQLERVPLPAERAALARRGIELLEFVGGNAYFARIAPQAPLDGVELLRWAGPVLPQDKISPPLWERLKRPAPAPGAPVTVVVSFADGTPADDARRTVEKHARGVQPQGPHASWTAEIEPDAISKLAGEPNIRWIEEGPPPGFAPLAP